MIELGPEFNLIVNFIEVIDHLHFSVFIVANGAFSFQCRLMHHLHGKFDELIVTTLSLAPVS